MTYIRNTLMILISGALLLMLTFIILAVWERTQFEPDSPLVFGASRTFTFPDLPNGSFTCEPAPSDPYDVNRDGKVDIVDVSAVIGHTK